MKKFIFMAFTALLVIGCNNSQQKGNAATVAIETKDNTVKKLLIMLNLQTPIIALWESIQ